MIIVVPVEDAGLGPYDVMDVLGGMQFNNETHFRSQEWENICEIAGCEEYAGFKEEWISVLENLQLFELSDFIQFCNDDTINPSDYWLGYVYFRSNKKPKISESE